MSVQLCSESVQLQSPLEWMTSFHSISYVWLYFMPLKLLCAVRLGEIWSVCVSLCVRVCVCVVCVCQWLLECFYVNVLRGINIQAHSSRSLSSVTLYCVSCPLSPAVILSSHSLSTALPKHTHTHT